MKTGGIRGVLAPVSFDAFVLDPVRRQLTREGDVLHLTPKAFDLLVLLVDQAPRVIPKAELHERLWQDSFVSDATLVGIVKELRRVLDDRSRDHPIIRTAHRVGYAFNAALDVAPSRSASATHWILIAARRFVLHEGDNLIGRDPESDVWIDSAGVSRRHARLTITLAGVMLEDCGSKNGTRVANSKVKGVVSLRDGDHIRFGPVQAVYRCSRAGMSTETHAGNTASGIGIETS